MELKQPPAPIPDVQGATTLRVLRIAEPDRKAIAPTVTVHHMWGSLLARTSIQAQRSAVEDAVNAIEQIAVNSRSVAATAQEIAVAASRQDELAGDLAWPTTERNASREETSRGA